MASDVRQSQPVRDGPARGVGGWGCGWVGRAVDGGGTRGRERHAGGKASRGWAAEGAANIYKEKSRVAAIYKR